MLATSNEPRFESIQTGAGNISRVSQSNERMDQRMTPGFLLSGLGTMYMVNRILSQRPLNKCAPALFDWNREIIIVTGGSTGIGAATVQKLAKRGTTIVVLDAIPLTYPTPRNLHCYKCDLSDPDELKRVAETIRRDIGEPTIILANSGDCDRKTASNKDPRDIESTLGLLWTIQTFLPSLITRNHGHFLILGSQTGYESTKDATDYCVRKSAAMAIFEGIHSEFGRLSEAPAVRVSCISPGHTQTAALMDISTAPGISTITPEHVADTVAETLYGGQPTTSSSQPVPSGDHGLKSCWTECA